MERNRKKRDRLSAFSPKLVVLQRPTSTVARMGRPCCGGSCIGGNCKSSFAQVQRLFK